MLGLTVADQRDTPAPARLHRVVLKHHVQGVRNQPVKEFFKQTEWLLLGAILVLTFIVFAPAMTHDFVNWDDDVNVTQNRNVQNLNQESIKNMFTTTVIGGYTPLTTLSFAIEHHYFGLNPKVNHINNIILHLICIVLLFFILKRLGASIFVTVVVTLLFGIHPMRVESVAWVTERKDMLFTLFYFCAILLYIQFRKTGKYWLYLCSLLVFVFFFVIRLIINLLFGNSVNELMLIRKDKFTN
jgi:hypothetical protein